jgi:hypothetical protein
MEIVAPMALAALGGLVTSTLLNLVLLPALYLRLGPVLEPERVGTAPSVAQVGLATGSYMHEEA